MKRTFHYCDICGKALNPLVNWKTPLDLDRCDSCDLAVIAFGEFAAKDVSTRQNLGSSIEECLKNYE